VLSRLFISFPRGIQGFALLLLRAALGAAAIFQASVCLGNPDLTIPPWLLAIPGLVAGGFLVVGFLTPFATLAIGLEVLAIRLNLLPTCAPPLLDSRWALIFGVAIISAIAVLGPGAYSFDSRLYGRREIIIPPSPGTGRPADSL
jgi:hypothetical protein